MPSRLKYATLASSLLLVLSTSLHAQTTEPRRDSLSDQDRARRDASKVFAFIKFQALKSGGGGGVQVASAGAAMPAKPAALDPAKLIAEAPPAAGPASAATAALPEGVADLSVAPSTAVPLAPIAEAEVDLGLQLIEHVEPELPRQSNGAVALKSGSVIVRFAVGLDGKVTSASAREGSPRRLAVAAVRAVQQWRFAPLTKPHEAEVEIAFNLD